jgi:hypothetical protein
MDMKRLIIPIVSVVIFSLFTVSCYYDNAEALYPTLNNSCDTTNVTYTGTLVPILNSSCTGCHSGSNPSGSITLTSIASLQLQVSSGMLMKALTGTGVPIMPPSGSLSACKTGLFQIWIRTGMPN